MWFRSRSSRGSPVCHMMILVFDSTSGPIQRLPCGWWMFWMFWLQKSDMVPVISGFGLTLVIGWLRWFGWDSGDSVWMSGPGYFSFAGLFLAPIMFYLRYPELRMQEFCKNFSSAPAVAWIQNGARFGTRKRILLPVLVGVSLQPFFGGG